MRIRKDCPTGRLPTFHHTCAGVFRDAANSSADALIARVHQNRGRERDQTAAVEIVDSID
jgi:hypothetical protein